MMNKILVLALVLAVAAGVMLTIRLNDVVDNAPVVDSTTYELMVCLNNGDKPLFQGLVTDAYVGVGYVKFTEATGLRRFIQGATCILTKGLASDFQKADEAMKAANGGVENGPDPIEGD
jgi:hypothetical protein